MCYASVLPQWYTLGLNLTHLKTFMKKFIVVTGNTRILVCFQLISASWECDLHWYSRRLSACMLQCCCLFAVATSVGFCEDCVSAISSSSPLPFSICVLYGRNTIESLRKKDCDGIIFCFHITKSFSVSSWPLPTLAPTRSLTATPRFFTHPCQI